ncbi:MAG: nitroreductase family protein [Bacteroidales bacterium]
MKKIVIILVFIITSVMVYAQKQVSNAVLDNIHARKSVRTYKVNSNGSAIPVSKDTLELIVRAGMAAPSAMNRQPWEFYIVTRSVNGEPDLMNVMAEKLPYAKMLKTAGAAIVVLGNTEIGNLWQHDCAAAAENILLAIESLGLGGVWTAGFPYEDRAKVIKETLGIPDPYQPLCIIPLGYPAGESKPKDKWKPQKVHFNKW